jgi:carbon-monoxide dehydrogenase small subunit
MAEITVTVDRVKYADHVEPRTLLARYRREIAGETGTLIGCGTSNCGACTVLLNGESAKSCAVLAVQADGAEITAIKGMGNGGLHPLQEAFHAEGALQCGYCTPGMILAASDLLRENPHPGDEEIREGLDGNLSRCTGYESIVRAVRRAASGVTAQAVGAAAARADEGTNPPGDLHGAPECRRHLARVLTGRALAAAAGV